MKKLLGAFLAAIAMQGTMAIQADCYNSSYNCCDNSYNCFDSCGSCFSHPALEVKFAGLCPFEGRLRHIYSDVLPIVELEASVMWGCNIKPWVNVGYLWDDGQSIIEPHHVEGVHHNKTDLRIIPLTLGADYIMSCGCSTDVYFGLGAAYSWLKIHDHSQYVHEHVNKGAFGGVARLGAIYHVSYCVFIDAFVEYFYTRFNFSNSHHHSGSEGFDFDSCDDHSSNRFVERHDLNLSSVKFGLGLGYSF